MTSALFSFVPGRIEVLGKHTDYAGGSSLTCAAEFGLHARMDAREDGRLELMDGSSKLRYRGSLPPSEQAAPDDWTRYPWTLARRIARDFDGPFRGASVSWTGDLPQAAGLSSSSALLVMLFLALRETEGLAEREAYRRAIKTDLDLAAYLAALESGRAFAGFEADGGVGTRGGASDQTAILCSRADHLHLYSYDPHRMTRAIEVPAKHIFAIAVSGVAACKTGNAGAMYGRATSLASAAAEAWRRTTGGDQKHLGDMLRSASSAEVRSVLEGAEDAEFTGDELARRFAHFALEQGELIPAAVEALGANDLEQFGQTVDRSQAGAEELLGNQIPQTSFLQRAARGLGAVAASAFGAGFGGAVWALIEAGDAPAFLESWSSAYHARYPEHARSSRFLLTRAGGPARVSDQDTLH